MRIDTSKEFTSLYHKYTATHLQQSNSQFLLETVLTDGEMTQYQTIIPANHVAIVQQSQQTIPIRKQRVSHIIPFSILKAVQSTLFH